MTLPLIPGVRPDPEPGDPDASLIRHGNAILDVLDRCGGLAQTARLLNRKCGWVPGTAERWLPELARQGAVERCGRDGRALLWRVPLRTSGP